jgi:hypothetical protein
MLVLESKAGSIMDVPVSQVDELRRLFDSHGIRYWIDEHAFSIDDGPEMTVIYFGRGGDAASIQAILDSAY